jgi:hypothetical protein
MAAMSMTVAETRARAAIARQLNSTIDVVFTEYRLTIGDSDNQDFIVIQETVSRQISNMDISGARPIQRWQGQDGTWWILVEMKKSDARTATALILENQAAAFSQFRSGYALRILDAQLANSVRPIQVSN